MTDPEEQTKLEDSWAYARIADDLVPNLQSMHPVVCLKRTFKWGSQHNNNTQRDKYILSNQQLFNLQFLMRHVSTMFTYGSCSGNNRVAVAEYGQ
jgi:hypothetical protein